MKNIIFYSPDFSYCYSLLIYLQETFKVTTTTNIDVIKSIIANSDFDLLIMDAEPSPKISAICKNLKMNGNGIPVILTYVYKNQLKDMESEVKKFVDHIFYKPIDLNEFSSVLPAILK